MKNYLILFAALSLLIVNVAMTNTSWAAPKYEECEEGSFLIGIDKKHNIRCGESDWSNIANIPSGFADNTDDGFTSEGQLTGLLNDNYIRNQAGTTQSASFRISGSGRVGSLYVDGSIALYNGSARVVSCPSGMNYVETNLCIDASPRSHQYYWVEAASVCRRSGYHICTYAELDQALCHENLYSVEYNPNGRWIGNFVGDDTVLCGNVNISTTGCQANFEGHCHKNTSAPGRQYWCCLSIGSTQ